MYARTMPADAKPADVKSDGLGVPVVDGTRLIAPLAAGITLAGSFVKMPQVLLQGRFWAEEGQVFFADLQGRGFAEALGYEYKGTIQLLTTVAVWLATRAPLELAPYATTYASLLVQAFVAVQFAGWARRLGLKPLVTICLILLWTFLPITYEIWANATNLQTTCAVSTLLVLLMPARDLERRLPAWALWVALCGLTGVPSCMLIPGFALRATAERSRPHLWLGALLVACAGVQLSLILRADLAERAMAFDAGSMGLAASIQTIVLPLAGVDAAGWIVAHVRPALVIGCCAALVIGLAGPLWRSPPLRLPVSIIGGSWLVVTGVSLFGALGQPGLYVAPLAGARYFVVGSMSFCLLLAAATASGRQRVAVPAGIALGWMALLAVLQPLGASWTYGLIGGPAWSDEVALCRHAADRSCAPRIWPPLPPGLKPWSAGIRTTAPSLASPALDRPGER